jgi:hypothetical protein
VEQSSLILPPCACPAIFAPIETNEATAGFQRNFAAGAELKGFVLRRSIFGHQSEMTPEAGVASGVCRKELF